MRDVNKRHFITFPENLLSLLLHGVITLPDATSCDKVK